MNWTDDNAAWSDVLKRLAARPSRASAAAVGLYYVLAAEHLSAVRAGLETLRTMPCDITCDILACIRIGSGQEPIVVMHALSVAKDQLKEAISRGYKGLTREELNSLARDVAISALGATMPGTLSPIADELLTHVRAALPYCDNLPEF